MWYQRSDVVEAIKPVLAEYPRQVLIGLRGDRCEQGYRFDLDSWDPSAETYSWWTGTARYSQEKVLKSLSANHKAEFIWSMPTVSTYSPTPYSTVGSGYPWQKAKYYAAYLQYMIGTATMNSAQYNALNPTYDFFTDSTCNTVNAASEAAVGGNWANLRAKRGRVSPYPMLAVILGVEPYGDAQEAFIQNGAAYGALAQTFRNEIRARGGACATIPLGLHVSLPGAISDFSRTWFKPMMDAVTSRADFSYLDMYHHYRFGDPADEHNRIFPTMVNTGGGGATSPGWQNWWLPQSSWVSDFSKYLWMYEDVRVALNSYGETASRWKIGSSEHGLSITSSFNKGNDMGAGLHWALYLAELMRYNVDWDMNWVFAEQGFSHAQLQFRDNRLTRTPGHYVYKMAQQFYGLEYRNNTYASPTSTTGTTSEGANYSSANVVTRVFRDPWNGHYHLFIVNKSPATTASVTGWESWTTIKWERISAGSFTAQNPVGEPWTPETIKTVNVSHTFGQPLSILPISVNYIVLADKPTVSVFTELNGIQSNYHGVDEESGLTPYLVVKRNNVNIGSTLSVDFNVWSGEAKWGEDYTLGAGATHLGPNYDSPWRATFAANQSEIKIPVTIIDDPWAEWEEFWGIFPINNSAFNRPKTTENGYEAIIGINGPGEDTEVP